MKELYLKKLCSILRKKSEKLSQTIAIINKDDLLNNTKIANEINELNNLNSTLDSIKPFLGNKNTNSLNDEIQLCANLLIVFENECNNLLLLEKKIKKYNDTVLTIGSAKLNSVEYKEIANTLDILQENYNNFKKDLLTEYDLIENLFKEICKGTSNFNSFLSKLNSCAKKVFIFEEL